MTTLRFREDAYIRQCSAVVTNVDERGIELDSTVFYPTGGGQPGDAGILRSVAGDIPIANTIKGDRPDAVIHVPAAGARVPAVGEAVVAEIDWDRRHRLMRFHTALHLLCSIVPGAVTRMAEGLDISQYPPMGPELVAPVVGWLAHESCSITGRATSREQLWSRLRRGSR